MTSSLPEPFRATFAGLEEQLPIGASDSRLHQCFGCGPGHPTGLHVRCFKTADGVISPIIVSGQYSGPPGAAHGGIVAAYLDEVLAAAVHRATERTAVTGELTVRYVKPVPVETPDLRVQPAAATARIFAAPYAMQPCSRSGWRP